MKVKLYPGVLGNVDVIFEDGTTGYISDRDIKRGEYVETLSIHKHYSKEYPGGIIESDGHIFRGGTVPLEGASNELKDLLGLEWEGEVDGL